jgi:hypothetical protein
MVEVIEKIADEVFTMSTSTPSAPDASHSSLRSRVGLETIVAPLRATSFYAAVALPLAYVPMLVSGLDTVPQTVTFLVLLALNLVAFIAGHSHEPGE